jgi:hypothetical protein
MQKHVSLSEIEGLRAWPGVIEDHKPVGIAQAAKFFHRRNASVETANRWLIAAPGAVENLT